MSELSLSNTSDTESTMRVRPSATSGAQAFSSPARIATYATLTVVGATLDLASKAFIFAWRGTPGLSDTYWIVDGFFGIETAVNPGAVFGIGAGQGTMFAALSVVAGIGILVWLTRFGGFGSWWLSVALGLVSGGIIGNLYDRLGLWWQPDYPLAWQSGVRDWILWQASDDLQWPNFNIADSLLVVGAGMLMYRSLFPPADQMAKAGSDDSSGPAPPSDPQTQAT